MRRAARRARCLRATVVATVLALCSLPDPSRSVAAAPGKRSSKASSKPSSEASSNPASKPSNADVKRAEELYDNGHELYAEGSYEAAALAFEQAYALSGNVDMLYNAALAYDRADAFEQAISALDRYRALAPAAERAKLDARKTSLETRWAQAREHDAAATTAAPVDPKDAPHPDAAPSGPRVLGPAVWGLGGSAIAAFAIGTGFGAASLVRSRNGREHCTGDDPPLCDSNARTDAERSRTFAIVADVAFAVGGALTIALITVVAVKTTRKKRARSASAARIDSTAEGLLVRF